MAPPPRKRKTPEVSASSEDKKEEIVDEPKPASRRSRKSEAASSSSESAASSSASTSGKWLFKEEPDHFSMDDLKAKQTSVWSGIRNRQARNFLSTLKDGDEVIFYYSSCKKPGIAGTMAIVGEAYIDPEQFNSSSKYYDAKMAAIGAEAAEKSTAWLNCNVRYLQHMKRFISLDEMKTHAKEEGNPLSTLFMLKQQRLSVSPVTQEQWDYIMELAQKSA